MFSELGFSELVRRARNGARRSELAPEVPLELLGRVCAFGSAKDIAARIAAYREAGADIVAVVPSTAEDPACHRALRAVSAAVPTEPRTEELAS
jgi:alkanesulfonate monooxygenase SsuD/methylene tetrahydromethanopterin reductase-like flavin-dependent oxidoreductase (luciferase family)